MTDLLKNKATEGFAALYGYQPTGVWSAPGRVNLIGEHTDYNEGFVFPFAINRRTFAAVALRNDSVARVASAFSPEVIDIELDKIDRATVSGWSAYPLGVAWALKQIGNATQTGFDIFIESDVPVGAGLSSSAAIECAVAVALNELWSVGLELRQLARVGQLAENEIVGAPTGIMDQSASLLGQLDHAVFLDCRDLSSEVIELGFAREGLELLIIDTKVEHRHADGGYASRRAACEAGAAALGLPSLRDATSADLDRASQLLDDVTFRRVRHVITENDRVLQAIETLRSKGPRAIGGLLYESHKSMRDDFEISIDELDTAVETALQHGAIGARMTGGGFGGAAIALCPVERIGEITLAVEAAFKDLGFAKPDIFGVTAAPGAHRE
ncbi:MAG: galactokinase [Actinomycetota bacterium]|jgi:galactokinase